MKSFTVEINEKEALGSFNSYFIFQILQAALRHEL